jgi:hypothetical protein
MLDTSSDAGWDVQTLKALRPDRIMENVGIVVMTISKQLQISEEQLHDIKDELAIWYHRKVCSK